MPMHCIGERRSPTQIEHEEDTCSSIWQHCPDSILMQIFSNLNGQELLISSMTCKGWYRVAEDEFLWKELMNKRWGIHNVPLAVDKCSWRAEYKRLHYHTPMHLSETLHEHNDEVLHVSFSHSGEYFSTTSKDATLKVWQVGYPTQLKYSKDFRELLSWDFTQFSCFNQSDSLLLVSSVSIRDNIDRRGFVAVLAVSSGFHILRVVSMNPSQLFGAWLDESTFLGGCLEISLDRFATTVQIESYKVPELETELDQLLLDEGPEFSIEEGGGRNLFTFSSETASLIKFLTVARIPVLEHQNVDSKPTSVATHGSELDSESDGNQNQCCSKPMDWENNIVESDIGTICESKGMTGSTMSLDDMNTNSSFISHDPTCSQGHGSRLNETSASTVNISNNACDITDMSTGALSGTSEGACCSSTPDNNTEFYNIDPHTVINNGKKCTRNLIFVTGEFALALHQLGFKNVSPSVLKTAVVNQIPQDDANANVFDSDDDELGHAPEGSHMVVNISNNDIQIRPNRLSDEPDHRIDLYGHVTGLCLSEDHRYLFLNCRPWTGKVDKTDPWATPDLSAAIEVRVIDLCTLKDTGIRYVGHKGYSPSTMCCFVFLDVSKDYIGSGSEDAKGYLWDRHYQTMLATLEHTVGVVNGVAFNTKNQEYLVTVSDDNTIKIWRSKHLMKSCTRVNE